MLIYEKIWSFCSAFGINELSPIAFSKIMAQNLVIVGVVVQVFVNHLVLLSPCWL